MAKSVRLVAKASERLLYTLFFALPLVGWGMLSAGHYPIVLFGAVHLPPILLARPELYATLRETHTILAHLLFLAFLAHMGAILFHTLILRTAFWTGCFRGPFARRKAKAECKPVTARSSLRYVGSNPAVRCTAQWIGCKSALPRPFQA
jgi:hypothetical protein